MGGDSMGRQRYPLTREQRGVINDADRLSTYLTRSMGIGRRFTACQCYT